MKTQIQTRIGTLALTLALLGGLAPRAEAAVYWTGATDTNWNTAGNWNPSPPTSSDDVIVTNGAPRQPSVPAGFYTYNSLSISNGATVTCLGDTNSTYGSGVVFNITADVTIAGTLTANYQGFAGGSGPGAGGPGNGYHGSGGGYGGRGGENLANATSLGGITYGSATNPMVLGSGGGNATSGGGNGGSGGGAIEVNAASGTVTINGTVSANGANSPNSGNSGGGGSGGSVWIIASTLAGTGTVSAAGGGLSGANSGGGGGGRICLTWTAKTFTGEISAAGGVSHNGAPGRNGTYRFPDNNDLTVAAGLALAPGTYNIPNLLVTNSATLECQGDTNSTFGSGVIIIASNIAVYGGSTISADMLGFPQTKGPKPGSTGWQGGGGGYGGGGGAGSVAGGGVSGAATNPLALGSGGGGGNNTGSNPGGWGGGALKLIATNLTINGTVTANGQAGSSTTGNNGGGGGSGGSIWMIAGAFAGSPTIQANGGSPFDNNDGGGGGGRIALEIGSGTATCSTLNALLGSSGAGHSGTNGTVYINGTFALGTNLAVAGFLTSTGSLDLAGFNITVSNTFAHSGTLRLKGNEALTSAGFTLSTNASTVVYYDSAVSAYVTNLPSTTNFWNLTFGAGKTHYFAGGTRYRVSGTLASDGNSGNRSLLRSTTSPTQWQLNLRGASALSNNVNVADSDASSGNLVSALGSVNFGNNTNWDFGVSGTPPGVANAGLGPVTVTAADLKGTLTSHGLLPTDVWVFWGTNDPGMTATGWLASNQVAAAVSSSPVGYTNATVNLTPGTAYSFRYFAVNSEGGTWADPATSFTTTVATAIANVMASNVTETAAELYGNLSVTNGPATEVWVYWGTNDPGMTTLGWTGTNYLGPRGVGVVHGTASPLQPETAYRYRFLATNIYGQAWGDPAGTFFTSRTKIWTGSVSSNWNDAANWRGGVVPGFEDDVIVTNTARSPLVPAGAYTYNSLSISNGATVTCLGDTNSTYGSGVIFTVGSVTIAGTLTADNCGFPAVSGPGAGAAASGSRGNGGAHGGFGGRSSDGGAIAAPYGTATAPVALGSGGGQGGSAGGAGGGAIKIDASGGTVTISGTVKANGSAGGSGGNNGGGGGAGGSVWIIANTLAGSGAVQANGGSAGGSGDGGGGSGGRIRLTWTTRTFSGTVSAAAGAGNTFGMFRSAGAGTYSFPDNQDITVNAGLAFAPGTYNIPALVVTNATLECQGDTNSTYGAGVIINATSITVYTNGVISANGLGFPSAKGPGAGTTGSFRGSGAGYGGRGGSNTTDNVAGGPTYTNLSVANPTALGSGGGNEVDNGVTYIGGFGGGAIKLNATGTLTLNGTVSANGEADHGSGGNTPGGGSGGSVWIVANTLAGSGAIRALGGNNSGTGAGAGGGGRIALEMTSGSPAFTEISAAGGTRSGTTGWGTSGTVSINGALTLGTNLVVAGFLTSTGSLDLAGYNVAVSNTFAHSGTLRLKGNETLTSAGFTLSTNASTVVYYDSAVSAYVTNLPSTTNFWNLTFGAGKTHYFAGGARYRVSGTLASDGVKANKSLLRSTASPTQWQLNLQGASALSNNVNVADSDASSGNLVSALGSVNFGNNTNWDFGVSGTPPGVANAGVGPVTVTTADLKGTLTSHGLLPTDVWVFWGTNSTAPWQGSNQVAAAVSSSPVGYTNATGSLTPGTAYSFRYFAVNSEGGTWADPATSFTTVVATAIANVMASNVTETAAELYGNLSVTNGPATEVWVYWGTNDPGMITAGWTGTNYLGPRGVGVVHGTASPLQAETAYRYRFLATNIYGQAWSDPAGTFFTSRTKIWTGAASTNWNDAANWRGGVVPGVEDDVIVTNGAPRQPSVPAGSYTYNSLSISNGATVTCLGDTNSTYGAGVVFTVTSATIAGTLTADGWGFAAAGGPGGGVMSPDGYRGNGGAHGGYGGRSSGGGAIAAPYGSATAPVALGSGGGQGGTAGGAGGGAIKIDASGGTVTISGTVKANGSAGGSGGNNGGGGGAGGSIWILANTLAGSGTVQADGGSAGGSNDGGGGSGGRIRLTWTTKTFTGLISATPGAGNAGNATARPARAGTYSFPDTNNLTVTAGLALAPGTYTIPTLIVTNATLECQGDTNGTYGAGVIINATAITVYPGATISADGLGFLAAAGPGAGSNGTFRASGGGYGGRGGATIDSLGGGGTYTNLSEASPLALGSGGGNAGGEIGGYGGGAIKLNATGTLRIDGTVRADGQSVPGSGSFGNNGGGGGSGGSIWILGSLVGTGTVQAAGGAVVNTAAGPGGGGGGRISFWIPGAVTCATNVAGGTTFGGGAQNGSVGTVWVQFWGAAGTVFKFR